MIVMTLGTFDLFHAGHVNLLRRCRDLAGHGGRVIVGLNTDDFVERYKGFRPAVAYDNREAVLRACSYVDAVVPNEQAGGSAGPIIAATGANIIAIGSDWEGRDYLGQLGIDQVWIDARGIGIAYLPYTQGISSSAIRERVR